MTVKSLATGIAAIAAIGAAAAGVTCIASVTGASPRVQPVVFGAPLPLDPMVAGADLPTPDQLSTVLNTLQDPSVSFASKGYLIEGGIPVPASLADHELQKAASQGQPAADVQLHQHHAGRSGYRAGDPHRDRPAPRPDIREPHVRQPGRLEAVA